MNDIFEFHKHLNFKKIILFILLIILIILICFFIFNVNHSTKEKDITFSDSNNIVSFTLPSHYELIKEKSSKNTLISLYSKNNLNINLSKIEKQSNKTLSEIVLADRTVYTSNYKNISNLSEVSSINANYIESYTYSFNFKDNGLTNTIHSIWIEIDSNYYIFDIKYPEIDKDNYTNLIKELLSSFTILKK